MCFGQKHKRLLDLLKKKNNRKKAPPIYIRGLAWFDRRGSQKRKANYLTLIYIVDINLQLIRY